MGYIVYLLWVEWSLQQLLPGFIQRSLTSVATVIRISGFVRPRCKLQKGFDIFVDTYALYYIILYYIYIILYYIILYIIYIIYFIFIVYIYIHTILHINTHAIYICNMFEHVTYNYIWLYLIIHTTMNLYCTYQIYFTMTIFVMIIPTD